MSIAPLTMRQRLALVVGTSISAETVLGMDDEEFTSEFLQAHGVCAPLLKAARITPIQLKARGVRTARDFHSLEFDTLDLVDGAFCAACVSAFGAEVRQGLATAPKTPVDYKFVTFFIRTCCKNSWLPPTTQ